MTSWDEYVAAKKEWKDAVVTRFDHAGTAGIVRDVNFVPLTDGSVRLEADVEYIGHLDHPIRDMGIRRHRFKMALTDLIRVPALEVLARIDTLGI
jgi:hypothetical protein